MRAKIGLKNDQFLPYFFARFYRCKGVKTGFGEDLDVFIKWKEVADRLKEERSPFFSAVAELAGSRGFEVAGVNEGALTLNLNGEFAAMVDETGAMNYHPWYVELIGLTFEEK